MKWSGSKLSLADLCWHAFAEDHIREIPRPPHPALAGGSSAHDGLELMVRATMDDQPIDTNAIARRVCAGGPAEFADTLEVLERMHDELADEPPPFRPEAVIHVEERLYMDVGPHSFDGKSDIVERYGRTCRITDWKTHWRPLTQPEFERHKQLSRYALLIAENHPGEFDQFELRMRFVRYQGAVRERTLDRIHLDAVKWDLVQEIEEKEAQIAAGHFPATPGDWCSICSRTDTCPVVLAFLEHGYDLTMDNDEAATRAAEMVRAIDAHSAKLKRQLKRYLGGDHRTGRVQLAGGSYGYGPSKHRRADVEDVTEVFTAHGRPVNKQAFRVDVDELQRALDREPGAVRSSMEAVIEEFEQAECRYRRGERANSNVDEQLEEVSA